MISIQFLEIFDILDSLFKALIYEILDPILKIIVLILKSLNSTFGKFIILLKVLGITLIRFISLCKVLYEETKNMTLFNSFEAILNQNNSAKNNLIRLFKIKGVLIL